MLNILSPPPTSEIFRQLSTEIPGAILNPTSNWLTTITAAKIFLISKLTKRRISLKESSSKKLPLTRYFLSKNLLPVNQI